jgi:hypothetical protein
MSRKHAAQPRTKATLSPELEKERSAILDLLAREEDEHWQIGVHYNRIVDGRLAQDAGFKSAQEFVSQRLGGISQATLTEYGAIAKAFPEAVAKKYGSTLLARLLSYERLTGVTLPTGDPGEVAIKVPNEEGSTSNKRFADCVLEDLRAALHQLHPPPKPIPPDDRRIVEALQKTLERMMGSAEIPIAMHARRGLADTFVVFNLPMRYLEDLRDVLRTVLGKPGDPAVRSSQAKPRSRMPSKATKPPRHPLSTKNKQIPRRNGQPRSS